LNYSGKKNRTTGRRDVGDANMKAISEQIRAAGFDFLTTF